MLTMLTVFKAVLIILLHLGDTDRFARLPDAFQQPSDGSGSKRSS
jgi:hypothetical protein